MENGKCPKGQYYCYTNKECRPIPAGFMIDPEGMLRKENGASVDESNKSGDNSLRDWFGKSSSSDGKPGWVQLGGKYAGKPCAKQPGQKTKPKCGSSKMSANLDDKEEKRAFNRKQRQDPNPNRKGKAINVKTEETILERGDFWHPDPEKDRKLGGPGANARAREDRAAASKPKEDPKKLRKGESYMDWGKRQKANKMKKEEFVNEKAGEKDACYHKVKSRYSVWPSAYASGALVKCRKKGAANWGNSTKKEEFEFSNWRDDFKATEFEFTDIIKPEPLVSELVGEEKINEKCWKGYKKKGMKTMFGKRYPNCVKENEKSSCNHTDNATNCPVHGMNSCDSQSKGGDGGKNKNYIEPMGEAVRIPSKTGNIIGVILSWRGKTYMIKMFFPTIAKPSRSEVQDQITKVYPGGKVHSYKISEYKPGEQFLQTEDWQKVNKSDKTDGMSPAAVKAYRRENPGSNLKTAVTGDPKPGSKDSKRRKSYCSRSAGQKKMHNIDCSKTPDKAICKARRRWKC